MLITILVILLVLEIILRINSGKLTTKYRFTENLPREKDLVFVLPPNKHYKLNTEGFRDYEFSLEKKEDVFRIVAIGDSFTFGDKISQKDTYGKQLEEMLNNISLNNNFEVYNFGVGGYNTFQESLVLEQKAIKYKPDMIILQFLNNDMGPIMVHQSSGSVIKLDYETEFRAYNGFFVPFSLPVSYEVNNFLAKNSYLFRVISIKYNNIKWKKNEKEYEEIASEKARESLAKIKKIAEDSNAQLIVVNFPVGDKKQDMHIDFEQGGEPLIQASKSLNLTIINLYSVFKNYDFQKLKIDYSGHLTPKGYKITAETILQYLLDNDLLPEEYIDKTKIK